MNILTTQADELVDIPIYEFCKIWILMDVNFLRKRRRPMGAVH